MPGQLGMETRRVLPKGRLLRQPRLGSVTSKVSELYGLLTLLEYDVAHFKSPLPPPGPLGNRRLLALARLVGGSWMDLGRQLQVPDDELQEVLQNEGMSYQGAFKILWGWRDRNEDAMHQDNVEVLKEALHKTGREDLIKEAGL